MWVGKGKSPSEARQARVSPQPPIPNPKGTQHREMLVTSDWLWSASSNQETASWWPPVKGATQLTWRPLR